MGSRGVVAVLTDGIRSGKVANGSCKVAAERRLTAPQQQMEVRARGMLLVALILFSLDTHPVGQWWLTLITRLECNGVILAHCKLCLLSSRDSPASGITGMCHHTQLIFVFLVEIGFHYVGQAGLEILTSGDPPASAFQSAGITGMRHRVQPL
ncbi:hypothetical protein AAY473_026782 [Plecturocebus cupreus]